MRMLRNSSRHDFSGVVRSPVNSACIAIVIGLRPLVHAEPPSMPPVEPARAVGCDQSYYNPTDRSNYFLVEPGYADYGLELGKLPARVIHPDGPSNSLVSRWPA